MELQEILLLFKPVAYLPICTKEVNLECCPRQIRNFVSTHVQPFSTIVGSISPEYLVPHKVLIFLQLLYLADVHARTAKVLLLMVVPGHLIFVFGIRLVQAGHTSVTPMFLIVYCTAALFQVLILLYIAQIMVLFMWQRKIDPDNSAIPYLTALGDLLGGALLAMAFVFLFEIGDKDQDLGD